MGKSQLWNSKLKIPFLTNQPIAYIMLHGQTKELCQEKGQQQKGTNNEKKAQKFHRWYNYQHKIIHRSKVIKRIKNWFCKISRHAIIIKIPI